MTVQASYLWTRPISVNPNANAPTYTINVSTFFPFKFTANPLLQWYRDKQQVYNFSSIVKFSLGPSIALTRNFKKKKIRKFFFIQIIFFFMTKKNSNKQRSRVKMVLQNFARKQELTPQKMYNVCGGIRTSVCVCLKLATQKFTVRVFVLLN